MNKTIKSILNEVAIAGYAITTENYPREFRAFSELVSTGLFTMTAMIICDVKCFKLTVKKPE
jgi:hypothetical protein